MLTTKPPKRPMLTTKRAKEAHADHQRRPIVTTREAHADHQTPRRPILTTREAHADHQEVWWSAWASLTQRPGP